MAKFPKPPRPAALAARVAPEIRRLPAGIELRTIYFRDPPYGRSWNAFRHYGPLLSARFDHHEPPPRVQARGILYCGRTTPTCVAEVFQRKRTINRSHRAPCLAIFELTRAVTLLNLCADWPTRAGASQVINSGRRDRAREWSSAIYEAWPGLDGLLYRSSMHGGGRAVALFERAEDALPSVPLMDRPLDSRHLDSMLRRAGTQFGYRLL